MLASIHAPKLNNCDRCLGECDAVLGIVSALFNDLSVYHFLLLINYAHPEPICHVLLLVRQLGVLIDRLFSAEGVSSQRIPMPRAQVFIYRASIF